MMSSTSRSCIFEVSTVDLSDPTTFMRKVKDSTGSLYEEEWFRYAKNIDRAIFNDEFTYRFEIIKKSDASHEIHLVGAWRFKTS